ncbi:MAG: hypothetical protein KKC29_10335 [Alphaproteobacteria bacterium]|nr:hypothetical protein [Alphaproteobacteria bacterium]MBU2125562.1 hypothetical protein [Alphaproteobacteria bacterium]MBU2209408.1 hypothetical protein [Alphaproteobacteria bacterium]MBU2291484.1 hypothetical protein [Alphaproteobacteria bacterium]
MPRPRPSWRTRSSATKASLRWGLDGAGPHGRPVGNGGGGCVPGVLGQQQAQPGAAFLVLAALCVLGTLLGLVVWPAHDPENLVHSHDDLDPDDPHPADGDPWPERGHAHPFVIDERHRRWPSKRR